MDTVNLALALATAIAGLLTALVKLISAALESARKDDDR